MTDFRFTCPFCTQHMACPPGYTGLHIKCPSCLGEIQIPAPVAGDSLPVAIAHSPPLRLYAAGTPDKFWTPEAWDRHTARLSGQPFANSNSFFGVVAGGILQFLFHLGLALIICVGILFAGCLLNV